ncbi:hypothetical protein IEQ34_003319 [Dendrobium chrysotoxum]|uniref:Uncharacterized protein n=1 Tax=Dendrobium chrysotoxum TaxID=161865 RepID=A0AAV7HGS6_DENCH|nr:hypothetical protein IEQ34_003319 [Dendrobium chrysotoxum]
MKVSPGFPEESLTGDFLKCYLRALDLSESSIDGPDVPSPIGFCPTGVTPTLGGGPSALQCQAVVRQWHFSVRGHSDFGWYFDILWWSSGSSTELRCPLLVQRWCGRTPAVVEEELGCWSFLPSLPSSPLAPIPFSRGNRVLFIEFLSGMACISGRSRVELDIVGATVDGPALGYIVKGIVLDDSCIVLDDPVKTETQIRATKLRRSD